ncbi:MAG: type 1 glutamine amidotransferase [Jhaorihella sp.]
MHLAILMTNTDESAFARARPGDGEKFTDLVRRVRPGWRFTVFAVKDGLFPDDAARFDGLIITGSPASVNSGSDWVARLLDLICGMVAQRVPVFGACFGHQAIALALGGTVGANPGGWVHGLVRTETLARKGWMLELPDRVNLYASHSEQVTALPGGARVLARSEGCAVAGFAIGDAVYTTQHHPEMSAGFIADLTGELAHKLGPQVTERARASLAQSADMVPFAESIARFFELASRPRRPE